MSIRQKINVRRITGAVSAVALMAGSLVAVAPSATAAPGDITTFPTGSTSRGIAEDPSGNLWVVNQGANSVSKVALDGTTVTYALPIPSPTGIALGSDGAMWVTSFTTTNMGRVSAEGAVQTFDIGAVGVADLALGPDGNIWFPMAVQKKIGKITPSGAVTSYDAGNLTVNTITPGPKSSNRMYVGATVDNKLGIITMAGEFTPINAPASGDRVGDVQLINDQVWFISQNANAQTGTLTRLVNDSGFTQVVQPTVPNPTSINVGFDGTMWVTDSTNRTINHFTTAGNLAASYGAGGVAYRSVQAQDGNVWATVGDGVNRILTGVVPTSTAAPAIEPSTGLNAGSAATATNGTWNYRPTSYSYQWQSCATSDATSCADVPGATGQSYTVATTDVGKYLRVGVRATNLNGASDPAYSGLVATGAAPLPPNPNPTPQPAAGDTASIGNGVTMTLDAPAKQKRNKRKWYEVDFSASDVQGTVVFEFSKGKRSKTKTVTIEDGLAEYRWKTPRKWRKGRTTVTATFIPAAGSPYTAAEVTDRVRIR